MLNNEGQNFPRGGPKKLPVGKFSELDFDRFTDTNSSLSKTMTFILKMTKFWVFSNAKVILLLRNYHSF